MSDYAYALAKNSAARLYGFPPARAGAWQLVDSMYALPGTNGAMHCHTVHSAVAPHSFRFFTTTRRQEMRAITLALIGFWALSLSACNTVQGAGKDVKAGGQAVENAAKDAKPK
jgi:predicted small secreted protein